MSRRPQPRFDSIDEALEALTQKHPRKIDLSLERLRLVLKRLGNPQNNCPPIIHVAGTNGKGSTVAFLRAILEAAGKSVHVYTSPHLVRFHERIRLAGQLIEDADLLDVLSQVARAAGDDPITFFEATTAAAFVAFANTTADVLLLEVGLGGRFDATNIIPRSDVGVITPVSFDHMEFLGSNLRTIAGEKAGIARRGVPLVVNQPDDDVLDTIEKHARATGAHPIICGKHYNIDLGDKTFTYKDARGALILPIPTMPGEFQCENAGLAVAALRHQTQWEISEAAITAGVRWAAWPARLQRIGAGALREALGPETALWLDGGHNPAAGAQIAKFIKEYVPSDAPVHVILGMLDNKDLASYLAPFTGLLTGLWGMPVKGHNHHPPSSIAAFGQELGAAGHVAGLDLGETLARIARHNGGDQGLHIFILGSLYLAGTALKANGTPPD